MIWQYRFFLCSENNQSCKCQLRSVLRHLTITSKQRNFLFYTCMLWERCQYLSCVVFLSGIESLNHSLLLVFLCGLKGSQLCVVYWLGGWRVNDYHQMPFKFQVLESFVRPTFTKDPKSISSTSHIKFCQCCQVHFHKLNGIWFNFVMLCNQLPLSFLEAE